MLLSCKNAEMCRRDVRYPSTFPDLSMQIKEGNIRRSIQDHRYNPLHFRLSVDVYAHRRSQCEGKCIRGKQR